MHTDSVKAGRFAVSVAGKRRGKGSSREASPYAELCAGIRLAIAESFERIYQQNCHNLGLFTSTDFGLIDRVRAGEAIPVEEFTRGYDPITQAIIRSGGLFGLTKRRLMGKAKLALPRHPPGPMTYAEKMIARAVVRDPATGQVGVVKAFEYDVDFAHHLVPGIDFEFAAPHAVGAVAFFWLYFAMTGTHALHLLIGIVVVMAYRLHRATRTDASLSLQITGLYWHFVDVVWIFLYPCLYLVART